MLLKMSFLLISMRSTRWTRNLPIKEHLQPKNLKERKRKPSNKLRSLSRKSKTSMST